MEKTKTKKPAVIHNLIKIKALLFLKMRQQTENRAATARQIAIATGGNPDSLYVLLGRWTAWELVHWRGTEPYTYMIAPEGERYLSKIDNWFFKGYYSKKRKKRVPGYRGKVEALRLEILIASKAVFWWRYTRQRTNSRDENSNRGLVCYFKAPFEKSSDFVKVEGSEGRAVAWPKDILLVIRCKNAFEADHSIQGWATRGKGMIQGAIDANIGLVWAKDAQQ